jgi:hypothetical protein
MRWSIFCRSSPWMDATVPVVGGSCLKVELRRRCRSSSRAVRTSPMRPRPSAPPVSPPGPWQQFRQIVHLDLPRHDLLEHIGEVGLGSSSRTSDRPCRTEGEPARRERQGARTVLPVVLPTTSCGLSTAEHRVRGRRFICPIDFRSRLVGGKITLQLEQSP